MVWEKFKRGIPLKFGHVGLSVSNLKRSVAFYCRYFGLRYVKTYTYVEKGFTIALLKKGDISLELFEFEKHKPLPAYRQTLDHDLRTLGVKHFSVEVTDIRKVYQKFKRAKTAFATDLRIFDNGARYFFIKDPDGILVEVMEAK